MKRSSSNDNNLVSIPALSDQANRYILRLPKTKYIILKRWQGQYRVISNSKAHHKARKAVFASRNVIFSLEILNKRAKPEKARTENKTSWMIFRRKEKVQFNINIFMSTIV